MIRAFRIGLVVFTATLAAQHAAAQDTKAAKQTRERLKQMIAEIDLKDVGTKPFFEDVNRELEKPIYFTIDGTTGISNNTKLSYKAKNVTVEKLLNDVADKFEFGWVVISKLDNKHDGWIVIRRSSKGKERGYEAGKEPKKDGAKEKSSLQLPRPALLLGARWSRGPSEVILRFEMWPRD